MTDTLDRADLFELARHVGWPAISIHLPTHRTGPDVLQDPIRFRNLLRRVEMQLADEMRVPEIEGILAPARGLLDDTAFWRAGTEGLAVFMGRGESRVVRTPSPLPELARVGERYVLRPLLYLLGREDRFSLLALSKKRARLFTGDREGMSEVELRGVPEGMADTLAYDDFERQVNFHTRTPAGASGRGRGSLAFHGHGGIPDVEKTNITRYFREVDRGVSHLLRGGDAPLILAGVDYLLPLYREVNSYPSLVDSALVGNPDERPVAELHADALELLEPVLAADVERDLDRLQASASAAVTSFDVEQIAEAAHQGRVRVLFVTPQAQAWGSWNPESAHVESHDEPAPGDWDLADLTAVETLMHGGVVHAVDAIPGAQQQFAAIFRY